MNEHKPKILRIGLVGAPQSGKTSLVEYLRNTLKKEYQVIIAEEVPTRLLKEGLNPPYNISGLEFQLECLREYTSQYDKIDYNISNYLNHSPDKPIVILYDTLPSIGITYLSNREKEDADIWQMAYENSLDYFVGHVPDKIFITELLQGEYSIRGNVVRRELETQKILSIAEKIDSLYKEGIHLSNEHSVEERAGIIVDYIDTFFSRKYCPTCGNILPEDRKPYRTSCKFRIY